jgi:hypothetical protein
MIQHRVRTRRGIALLQRRRFLLLWETIQAGTWHTMAAQAVTRERRRAAL